MSKALEAIERTAGGYITDPADIDNVMNRLLDMKLEELEGGNEKLRFLSTDISAGCVLEKDSISKLTLRDILVMIGYMPGFPYFEVPQEDTWFYDDDPDPKFFSAAHCFFLGRVFSGRRRELPVVDRFMNINLWCFHQYLTEKEQENDSFRLTSCFILIKEFLDLYVYNNSDRDRVEFVTIGNLIESAGKLGSRTWCCGAEPIESYVNKVYQAYNTMRLLFMDAIRMSLIPRERTLFSTLLDSCSENGRYDVNLYEQIDFKNCYE